MKREYTKQIIRCQNLFELKEQDYGHSWKILRLPSLTDQIFIKANRIRTIQETKQQKIGDSIESEFIGIVNYAAMALMQTNASWTYSDAVNSALILAEKKNHDYGDAWRSMRISSITDLILMKILRLKQIEDNEGNVKVSEGIEANYFDILNYAVFCLIKIEEDNDQKIEHIQDQLKQEKVDLLLSEDEIELYVTPRTTPDSGTKRPG